MEFKDKRVVVTGGGRGIGRAICEVFAAGGASVVINYAGDEASAQQTLALCEQVGGKAVILKGDVSGEADCARLMDCAAEQFGGIDILVNNAGITRDGLLLRMNEADFDRVLEVNLKGAFLCTKQAAMRMVKQRSGRIINISSVVGLMGNAGQMNYAASKAGLIGLTKSAARELASRGITVNAIAPGFIETDMTQGLKEQIKQKMLEDIPLGKFGAPADIAQAALFLASDAAAYITGQVLSVNGGMYM